MNKLLLAAVAAASIAAPAQAGWLVTVEAPGVVNSTAVFDFKGVIDFDDQPIGTGIAFTKTFSFGPDTLTATYRNVQILPFDVFGGAGATGNYAVTFTRSGYVADVSTTDPRGVNYFGYWLSALDSGNRFELLRGGSVVFTFDPADVLSFVGANPGYNCNPYGLGNCPQQYAFINIFGLKGQTFDQIRFYEDPEIGGYESDNHTFGYFLRRNGTPVPAPGAVVLFGLGALALGAARRRG